MTIKERTLIAVKDHPGKTADQLAQIIGATVDGVRKALRAYECTGQVKKVRVHTQWPAKVSIWSVGDIQVAQKKAPKPCSVKRKRSKEEVIERDQRRLSEPRIKGERIVWAGVPY